MNYIYIFFSQSGAIMFKRKCEKLKIKCKLSPTPRSLSSSCGTCATVEYSENPEKLISEEVESIYEIEANNKYSMIFDNY